MLKTSNPAAMAPPNGYYSHVVEVPAGARQVFLAGQLGVAPDGTLAGGFAGQIDQVWQNTIIALASVGMGVEDIVRLTVYSTDPEGRSVASEMRKKYLGAHIPASTWLIVGGLANPHFLVEMDTIAAKLD